MRIASPEANVQLECRFNKAGKLVVDIEHAGVANGNRVLFHSGDDEFFTSGIPGVRLRFVVEGGKALSVSIRGTDLELMAKRVGG